MAGRTTSRTTLAGVVGIIKAVWYLAVDLFVNGSSRRGFGGTFSHIYYPCHQSKTILRIRAHLYIEPTAMTSRNTPQQ